MVIRLDYSMTYYYNISYDGQSDEFFAFVDDGTKEGKTIFQIDSTEEVCDYIRSGRMKHIDDADGLRKFLLEQEFLQPGDILILNQELLG